MTVVTAYNIELRDKNGALKDYLTPFVSNVKWEWNRIGGCGRCSITINKAYRGLSFDAMDDIQIRVKSGSTSKLVYRGYIANVSPNLKVSQDIQLDVRGYFDLLKKFIVHSAGDTLAYAAKTVAFVVDDIADTFIIPNSSITLGTIDDTDGSAFEMDDIDFLTTVDSALKTLAEIAGDVEYGVDEDLVFYWRTESTTITHKFFIGNNVPSFQRRFSWDNLVNKLYIVGGDVAGSKYKKTGENTDSQGLYFLSEEIINNSSITTDAVANQFISTILARRSIPKHSMRGKIINTDIRLEDTIPMGLVTFYDAVYDRVNPSNPIGDIIGASDTIVSSSVANPSIITATGHGFPDLMNGKTIIISGHAGSTPDINGSHVMTWIDVDTFSIPVNVTVGGTGGKVETSPADGSNIVIGEVGDGGSDVIIGGTFTQQIDKISYELSDTPGRFNIDLQLGDVITEMSSKLKRLERELASVTQYTQ